MPSRISNDPWVRGKASSARTSFCIFTGPGFPQGFLGSSEGHLEVIACLFGGGSKSEWGMFGRQFEKTINSAAKAAGAAFYLFLHISLFQFFIIIIIIIIIITIIIIIIISIIILIIIIVIAASSGWFLFSSLSILSSSLGWRWKPDFGNRHRDTSIIYFRKKQLTQLKDQGPAANDASSGILGHNLL